MTDALTATADTYALLNDEAVLTPAPAADGAPTWWPLFVTALKAEAGVDAFDTWLRDVRFASQASDEVTLFIPTVFSADLVRREYGNVLAAVAAAVLGAGTRVRVVAPGEEAPKPAVVQVVAAVEKELPKVARNVPAWLESTQLDARYTFASFVMGSNSQFPYAAAQRVADDIIAGSQQPVSGFNPFFIHGGVGLGKTHLMQAVGHAVRDKSPAKNILYVTAEQFLQKYVRAMRDKTMSDFKEIFRSVDMLLIDDVQFIAGKESTQEEFFHTFNTLVSLGKQVVLTADRSPHDLPGLEDRLKSRLGSGLTVEMHPPAVETRLAILTRKADERGLDLPADVAQFLAESIASNVRELEGALNRLVAFSQLTGNAITVPFARDQLRDLLRTQVKSVSVDDIQTLVATHFNLRLADILGQRRTKDLVRGRQVAQYLCKQLTTKSYPDIGRAFGGRDHTTVIHGVNNIQNLLDRDASLKESVDILTRQLRGS
ncbi:MAG TPA: chromosomal replication initiator protein DnaA [Alphaproteobacteria bacterium]|nr:chromosomal replication initiator protein DnaA [Alphaproteobacteria bacterium]